MLAILLATNGAGEGLAFAFIAIVWIVAIAIGLLVYFLPTIFAYTRKKPNLVAIAALNVFLGWSLIGWVVALVWALSVEQAPQQIIVNNVTPPPAPSTGATRDNPEIT